MSFSIQAEDLWRCRLTGFFLSAVHVADIAYVLADLLSRPHGVLQPVGTLAPSVLQPVWDRWFKSLLDRCAYTVQHSDFRSMSHRFRFRKPERRASSLYWGRAGRLCFPPFAPLPFPRFRRKVESASGGR